MFCQVCGSLQNDESEYCDRCNQKLLVVSGPGAEEIQLEEQRPEDNFSFDEHLLERISVLEEVLKRTAETVRDILSTLQKQEKNLLINHTGLNALADTLQVKGVIETQVWSQAWELRAQSQLLALEKRERFSACRDRIEALYRGKRRDAFLRQLRQAEVHFLSFELEAALVALEAAYALDRANYQLAHFLGETWFNEGDAEKALRYFTRVLDLKPDHYDCLVYSGVIQYEMGDLTRAEAFLERSVEVYPDAFLPLFCLGAIHARERRLEQAASYLERAVRAESVPQAYYLLGSVYHDLSRQLPAIRALRNATRLDPTFEEAHHLLGLTYLDRHWRRKALESFRQAQRLNPKKMRYRDLVGYLSGRSEVPLPRVEGEAAQWLERAEQSLQSDQSAEALRCYSRALRLEPENPTVLMSHALACLQMNRHQESEAITRKVLDLNPGEMLKATAYAALIEALRGEGRYGESNRIGVRLLDEGTSNFAQTIAYYEMAYNLAEMEEDLDRALDYAHRSLELAPDELKEFPLAALGWVHYKRREFEQAVEFLERSTELERSPTTLTHLGMALLASGNEEQARTVLREARRLGEREVSLQEKMMAFLRDSTRLFEALGHPPAECRAGMRWSRYYLFTTREDPGDAEVVSHRLMARAGMLRKLAAGIYVYAPLALRTIAKLEAIVRAEMNKAGGIELLMPAIQPSSLWIESGRWEQYGKELLRIKDRHEREFCFGPTHEEVITDLVRADVRSYRLLPFLLYQIQTKFRDEIRPRFGLMRGREFIMKDAYSFHADQPSLAETYDRVCAAYRAIFDACRLDSTTVEADTGTIGGSSSHEFMVLASTGESAVVACRACGYSANVEKAEAAEAMAAPGAASGGISDSATLREVATPGLRTIDEVGRALGLAPAQLVKTLIYDADGRTVAVAVRGDHEVNEIKLAHALDAREVRLADDAAVARATGAPTGFAGPVGLGAGVPLLADLATRGLSSFGAGANRADAHYTGVVWGRDAEPSAWADLRVVRGGDPCPRCGTPLEENRGIEVAHAFMLGAKYSQAMNATFTDDAGANHPFIMGCYGLGISRTVAAAIEQNHDENGIIWPLPLAPFQVLLVSLNAKDEAVRRAADELYDGLVARGVEVLYDDRDERPGVKFNDADLIGIPIRLVVGGKSLAQGNVELSLRRDREKHAVAVGDALGRVVELVSAG